MTQGEYKEALKGLADKYEADKIQLIKLYLNSNNPYSPGDIIKDHIGFLKIEKHGYYLGVSAPELVYYGIELQSNGVTPMKKQTGRGVYGSNIKP